MPKAAVLRLTRPVPSELAEQMALIQWWRLWAPSMGIDARCLIAIPNGSYLAGDAAGRARQMAKLKATGLRPGAPDLILALPQYERLCPGMFIEMKRLDGRPSEEQMEMCTLLRSVGYNVIIAKGAGEAMQAIQAYVGAR